MKIYLLRHATASERAGTDAERELTNEGEQEAQIAGAALLALGIRPGHVLSSPLVRAQQTARIVAKGLGFTDGLEILDELLNDVRTDELLKALKPYGSANELLLVGHMPSLADHLAECIGARNSGGLGLGKGAVACIEMKELRTGPDRFAG